MVHRVHPDYVSRSQYLPAEARPIPQNRSGKASYMTSIDDDSHAMRTTVTLDKDLLDKARRLSGIRERTALIREGLKALIERESARRLVRLGGSEPDLTPPQRRRSNVE